MPQRHSAEHKLEMARRATRRTVLYEQFNVTPVGFIPASLNRRTLQPHEHTREIARTLNRKGNNHGI